LFFLESTATFQHVLQCLVPCIMEPSRIVDMPLFMCFNSVDYTSGKVYILSRTRVIFFCKYQRSLYRYIEFVRAFCIERGWIRGVVAV
jgi:hypothetical protein